MNAAKILAAVALLALALGCNEKRQTYAEAVQLYEAEMKELERLEKRRDDLVNASQAVEAAGVNLNSARDLIGNTAADLNALREATKGLIDPAAQNKADKTVEENLKKIEELTKVDEQAAKKASEAAAKAKEAAEKELPELEQQIEKQKARVESAKAAKEALAP
jgi:hypothetical protein